MRGPRTLPAIVAALSVAACGGTDGEAGRSGDEKGGAAGQAAAGGAESSAAGAADSASLLAGGVMESLGGQAAWDSTRYIAFRWVVARDDRPFARSHAWDRWEGRYRLEFGEGEDAVLALFDVDDVRRDSAWGKVPSGNVWLAGERLEGAARDSALSRAYGAFINDTYWLLMPFKWRDPGVHLAYEGRQTLDDGREYAVVHLTFELDLGVTNDEYWAYVDPETGLMDAWRYHLQNQEEPGAVIRWEGWRPVGPIRLAADRVWPDGERRLWFEDLEAAATVPDGAFDPPGAP